MGVAHPYCYELLLVLTGCLFLHQMSPLHVAAKHGRVETVEYLVDEKEVEINIKDNDGVGICDYTNDDRLVLLI